MRKPPKGGSCVGYRDTSYNGILLRPFLLQQVDLMPSHFRTSSLRRNSRDGSRVSQCCPSLLAHPPEWLRGGLRCKMREKRLIAHESGPSTLLAIIYYPEQAISSCLVKINPFISPVPKTYRIQIYQHLSTNLRYQLSSTYQITSLNWRLSNMGHMDHLYFKHMFEVQRKLNEYK